MKKAIVILLLLPGGLAAEVRYNVVPLVPYDPAIGNSGAVALNQFGDAAGSFFDWPFQASHGFVYTDQDGFMQFDGAGGNLRFTGINNAGQMAGYDGMGTTYPIRYTPGVGFINLGTFGGRENETHGINNRGQVVGFSSTSAGNEIAFRYTDGVGLEYLGTLPGAQNSDARAINDAGWVTGTSGNRAFLYRDGVGMVDIGPGSGWAINDAGVVAGEASFQPVLYINGEVIPLGSIGSARGINNHNVVVGADLSGFQRAFIWSEPEGMQDLNSLIDPNSGWYLATAVGINDAGQIVGGGFFSERGDVFTAFRLDPILEPSTWALLALGGGLAALAWRKRQVGNFCLVR